MSGTHSDRSGGRPVAVLPRRRWRAVCDHGLLILASLVMAGPVLMVIVGAFSAGGLNQGLSLDRAGLEGLGANLDRLVVMTGEGGIGPGLADMVTVSLLAGLGVAVLATFCGFLAAFAMTFLMPGRERVWLGLTVMTLYFPLEARMLPTFEVAVRLGLVDTLAGLILPILPLALATLVFRAHMRALPGDLLEAARLDGAGPVRCLVDIVLPLSGAAVGAVFVISFLMGWNQYLWPLMISVDNALFPLMRGLNLVGTGSGPSMVLALVSILPPLVLVLGFLKLLTRITAARP